MCSSLKLVNDSKRAQESDRRMFAILSRAAEGMSPND
jgi:hypothetical protein